MVIKFIKLMFISGFLFLGNAYSSEFSERDMIEEDIKSCHRETKKLIDLFYCFYDSYKYELNNKGIHFNRENYLDIVEDNFQNFTGMRMNYYLNDYFNSKIEFSSKKAQYFDEIDFNIYNPLYSILCFFASCVIASPEYEESFSGENGWFLFIERLVPIALTLEDRSKTGTTHVINFNRHTN